MRILLDLNQRRSTLLVTYSSILPVLFHCAITGLLVTSCTQTRRDGDTVYWEQKIQISRLILERPGITREERGKAMTDMARAFSGLGEGRMAATIWQDVLSSNNVDEVSKARANYELGHHNEQTRTWEDAIKYYREYSRAYAALTEEQRSHFDQVSEDGIVVLYHIGEIQEYHLNSPTDAEVTYKLAVDTATTNNSYSCVQLLEHLGDFYLRQGRYIEAVDVFDRVRDKFAAQKHILVSPGSRPEYKILKALVLANKREEAEKRYTEFLVKWGKTTHQLDKEYVEKAQRLMAEHGVLRSNITK